jgi:hypothetical protein
MADHGGSARRNGIQRAADRGLHNKDGKQFWRDELAPSEFGLAIVYTNRGGKGWN